MTTECNQEPFPFHPLNQREVRGQFDGGSITSDAGGLLLREVEKRTNIIGQFASCFTDYRDPELVEHGVAELVAQRIYGLALGYEDLNDHEELRRDPLLAVLVEKEDVTGEERRRARDQGTALAGKSTLNRMELGAVKLGETERYKKIILDEGAVDRVLVDIFLQVHGEAPKEIVLDLDSTDIPLHGEQEERFFHGYYGHYCYLPLYIVCGEYVLCARLRPSNIDGAKGSVAELERIVAQIRQAWPQVRIIVRGDSGFCRDELLSWCEEHGVDYVVGIAQNARLLREIAAASAQAASQYQQSGTAARVFTEFVYQTKNSWSRTRRVIAKAEQMMLFADRTSTSWLRSNQIRLYFSTVAYLLMQGLRRLGLAGTELAHAQCHTVRLKLLKIGAQIRITVRKIWVSLSTGYPYLELFRQVHRQLQVAALRC